MITLQGDLKVSEVESGFVGEVGPGLMEETGEVISSWLVGLALPGWWPRRSPCRLGSGRRRGCGGWALGPRRLVFGISHNAYEYSIGPFDNLASGP